MTVAFRRTSSSRGMSSEVNANFEGSCGGERMVKSSVVIEEVKMGGVLKDLRMEEVMGSKK